MNMLSEGQRKLYPFLKASLFARRATCPDSTPGVWGYRAMASAPPESPSTSVGSQEVVKPDKMTMAALEFGEFVEAGKGISDRPRFVLGVYSSSNLKEVNEFLKKRVPKWERLNHPNIMPFPGWYLSSSELSIDYPPQGENGNIMEYMKLHPGAPRMILLLDVARGLNYLHSLNIPHGNIKGANIVINTKGHALLTEYGLAPIASSPSLTTNATSDALRNCRWMSPEIIHPYQKPVGTSVLESKPADVYAFGMVVYEVLTGKVPFEWLSDEAVLFHVLRGGRPEIPADAHAVGLSAKVWKLLEACWNSNPKKRPTMKEIVSRCEGFVGEDIATKEPLPPAQIAVEVILPGKFSLPPPNSVEPKRGRKFFCGLA
ncbi:kinase-like domain-containing protein [Thelephora terrestris]|uniref:Kinase-like domain-containing protein n=1 Tax=Thelephora terrestris TaxID=56493 RepID=A0A9P6HKE0_9AGAM|nr:kinase-like domain-containing protein [Thelephora terrestris]